MKSARGFVVREAQAGHSTVSFDYRIVATARGEAGERMGVTNGEALPRLQRLIASHPRFVP